MTPQLGAMPICWRWSLLVLSLLCWLLWSKHSHWVLEASCFPGIWDVLVAIPSSSSPTAIYFYSISWPSVLLSLLSDPAPLFASLSSLPPRYFPPSNFYDYFIPLLCRIVAFTLWSLFFLGSIWFVGCILGILSFCANIPLPVSIYQVYSLMSGLLHSGRYFQFPSIFLLISWSHCF